MSLPIFASLVRVLFPKWNFFDQIGHSLEIEFKVPGGDQWTPLSFLQTRKRFGLFLNPQVNLTLAHINILEHFAQDIQELKGHDTFINSEDVQRLTTFRMLKSLLHIRLQEFELQSQTVQFKLIAKTPDEVIDIYISDWIQLEDL